MNLATWPSKRATSPAHRVLVGAQDLAHLLGIEPAESAVEPTRSTNITVSWRRSACGAGEGRSRAAASSGGTAACRGKLAIAARSRAMADRGDPDLLQVLGVRLLSRLGVDVVVAERLLVPPQAQPAQPSPDVHRLVPHDRVPFRQGGQSIVFHTD